jgi:hemerythrin-like domain-containing protein
MNHSEVRERIFEDHERLRERLAEIEDLNERFEKGEAEVGSELRERGATLYEVFATHLTLEDAQLIPALRTIPTTGGDLARRLEREHREQRELLHFLVGRLQQEDRPTSLIARELQGFCSYLKLDMAHEESTILSEQLLQD